jgi:type VI secretion system protein ImpA
MASPQILDFEQLLAPIAGDRPTGADPRQDYSHASLYRQIKDLRGKAREAEKAMLFKEGTDDQGQAIAPPDWRPLLKLAPQALVQQAKDLEIAAVLIEALVREHGMAGLRDGFRLVRELVLNFWDQLYPQPDEEDGMRARVSPLIGLNGEEAEGVLIGPISRVPVTAGKSFGPFSLADYRQAAEIDRIQDPERRARRLETPGTVTLQTFNKAVSETGGPWFRNLLEDVAQCEEEFAQLSTLLEEKCGVDERGAALAPPTSAIREALAGFRRELENIARNVPGAMLEGTTVSTPDAAADGNGAMSTASGPSLAGGLDHVQTREEAFHALLRVADYFRRTEPHSPVSYALEQAVRWGRMALPELLQDLVPEAAVRQQMFRLVGINESTAERSEDSG